MIPVVNKISSIFKYELDDNKNYTGKVLNELKCNPSNYNVTAKIDGTCCYIKDGKIHPRLDLKTDKQKKNKPKDWFSLSEENFSNHMIGFRDLDIKKDKWHLSAINDEKAMFISNKDNIYFYEERLISDFNNKSCELVGPKVNGNKHQLEKHAYIVHGDIVLDNVKWYDTNDLSEWLKNDGKYYEGIVIHDFDNNIHYKCHREHLGLKWNGFKLPVSNPYNY